MDMIQKGDHKHRIQLGTDDEFGEVGHQVNRMLDNIQNLNERNTELLKLNSRIEMEQLTQQMNPHFLYNTLEIIRNLVIFDAPKAEELIVKLTEVLRYSVNTIRKEMTLEEDMQFIDAYLEIQNCRFGDRFHCEIHIETECSQCIVPKMLLQPMGLGAVSYGIQYRNKPRRIVVTDIDDAKIERAREVIPEEFAAENGVELQYINTGKMADPVAELRAVTGGKGYDDVFVYIPNRKVAEMGDQLLAFDGCLNFFAGPTDNQFKSEINLYNVHYISAHGDLLIQKWSPESS